MTAWAKKLTRHFAKVLMSLDSVEALQNLNTYNRIECLYSPIHLKLF